MECAAVPFSGPLRCPSGINPLTTGLILATDPSDERIVVIEERRVVIAVISISESALVIARETVIGHTLVIAPVVAALVSHLRRLFLDHFNNFFRLLVVMEQAADACASITPPATPAAVFRAPPRKLLPAAGAACCA